MPDETYNLNGGFKPTMKRFADLDGPDFFPTPRWATFALVDNEKFHGDLWAEDRSYCPVKITWAIGNCPI
jgi:hypothetical protein